ncbi:MAG: filamentous hemagglutinin N-terminal domain-containing protein, partial [Alphaproteobacteria bacterium]|nr:filamentous hemagglutinin N-terminal domain-containing protein [Alphaproteobacteria bacterium]
MNLVQTARSLNFHSNFLASSALVAASIYPFAAAKAAPQGGNVVGGSATITTGTNTIINQTTSRAAINWNSFSVAANESVNFIVPNGGATLNRVVGNQASLIQGTVSSNGSLYLVNPNGLVLDAGSHITAQNFIATTSNIDPTQFMAGGKVTLGKSATNARISLKGTITAADRGIVGIFAPQVDNQGTITANLGSVMLAGVQSGVIDFTGNGLINFELGATTGRAGENLLASNSGVINAAGGVVTLTAQGADELFNALVANSGSINATSLSAEGGVVTLKANKGSIKDSGTIEASGANGGGNVLVWASENTDFTGDIKAEALYNSDNRKSNGGAVEVSGIKRLNFMGTVSTLSHNGGKTGSLLLDPTEINIVESATPGLNGLTNASGTFAATTESNSHILTSVLKTALNTTDVTVDATAGTGAGGGLITVADAFEWDGTGHLTLRAGIGGIAISKNITSTHKDAGNNASPANLTLISGGEINQNVANSVITVKDLNVTAAGAISLNGSNVFTNLTGLTQTSTTGNISIKNAGAMNVTGAVSWSGSGHVTLDAGGALNINANITSTNATLRNLTLLSGGAITQAATGSVIKISDLTVTANGAVALNGDVTNNGANANQITNLAGFTQNAAAGNFGVTSKNDLRVTGSILNGTTALNVFTASGDVSLSALGNSRIFVENQTGVIKAKNITLSGSSLRMNGKISSSQNTNLVTTGTSEGLFFNQTGADAASVSINADSLTINATGSVTLSKGTINVTNAFNITAFGEVAADVVPAPGAAQITAGSLTANVGVHPTNTAYKGNLKLLNANNAISSLGAITANNIEIVNSVATSLKGNLTTTSRVGGYHNGTISIKGSSFSLADNITLTAAESKFDTGTAGGVATGSFSTGNTNKLTSASGEVYIVTGAISLSTTADYKSINVGTGTLHTAVGDGDKIFDSDITINNQFITTEYAGYRTGTALTTANLTHVQGNYTAARFNITAKSIELNGLNHNYTNNQSATIVLTSTVGAIATKGSITRLSGNVTLDSATTIDILSTANLAVDGQDSKLTLNSKGDINVKGLTVAYVSGSSANGSIILGSVGSTSNLGTAIRVLRLGNLTAANDIEVRTSSQISLEGNLTTNNGAGNIYVSTRSGTATIRLGANITTNGRTSFDLGGDISNDGLAIFSNQGYVAGTNYTLNTNNNDLAIIANVINLVNPDASTKAINAGTGSVYTGSLGGNITETGPVTINANVTNNHYSLPVTTPSVTDFFANNYIFDYVGVGLSQAQITNNINAANVTNAAQDITVTATTINAVQLFNYKVGNDFFAANQNARNITLIATGTGANAITLGGFTTKGNLTLQAQTGGVAINAALTVSGVGVGASGVLTINAGADVTSNSVITARKLSVNLQNSAGATANLTLNGANKIDELAAITATSISLVNAKALNLSGNLTTRSYASAASYTDGAGSIIISVGNNNVSLTGNVTTNATTTLFNLGGNGGGTFTTGNNVLSSSNKNMTIVANGFSFSATANAVNINLGTGSLSTVSGGGARSFNGDITINDAFITAYGLKAVVGHALTDAEKTHVTAAKYTSTSSPIEITSTGIITVDGLTYTDGLGVTLTGNSIVMGNTAANSFNNNLTLNSTGTILINSDLTLGDATNANLTMNSGGNITAQQVITANLVTVTASNPLSGTADVHLLNSGNQITKFGAITGTNIKIVNGKDLILMGDLKTQSNNRTTPDAPITQIVGAGSVSVTAVGANSTIKLGNDVSIYGNDNAFILLAADAATVGGSFNNDGHLLTVKNNQNLKILATGFTLNKPTGKDFAIDLGTGILSTFDAGQTRTVGGINNKVNFGDGLSGLTELPDNEEWYKSDIKTGSSPITYSDTNAIFKFGTQRVGANLSAANLLLVKQASDAAAKLAVLKTNVIHVLGDASFSDFNLKDDPAAFTAAATDNMVVPPHPLKRDLWIKVDGNVTFTKETASNAALSRKSSTAGANLTISAGKSMEINEDISVTGGTLTLTAGTGITVNNFTLKSTLSGGATGAVNLNGGRGVVSINSKGADYTIDNNVLTVTGSMFEVNLTGANNSAGKLIGINNASINSSAVNMAFLGSPTLNSIKIYNGTSGVTYVSVVSPDTNLAYNTPNSVLIDSRFVLPTVNLASASTGISLIDAAGVATANQTINLGLKYSSNVAITINDDNYAPPARGATVPSVNFAAGNLTWIEGGSINIVSPNTYFNKQLVLRSNGSSNKMVTGRGAASADIYANIYIAGSMTTGGNLVLLVNKGTDVPSPALSSGVASANNYGLITRGAMTVGGDLVVSVNNNVFGAGSNGAAASVSLAAVTTTGGISILTNADVTSAGGADADGIILNGAVQTGNDVIIQQNGDIRATGIGTATGVNLTQLITTGTNVGNVIVSTAATSSAASAAGSSYGIKLSSITAGGYVSLVNNMGNPAFSYTGAIDGINNFTGIAANYLKLSIGTVSAYGIFINGGTITTNGFDSVTNLGLSVVNNANVAVFTSPNTVSSDAIGIYGAIGNNYVVIKRRPVLIPSVMNINAGGLKFNNSGTIISAVSGNNKRSFNARGIDLAQNLTSVAGQDITLVQTGTIAAKTSGEGAGIVVRGVVNSGHDFIVNQNGQITSAYLGNAYGYQQIGTVNAANNVKISNVIRPFTPAAQGQGPRALAAILTYSQTYNFGSAYGVYMNNAITAGGDVYISNEGHDIESLGTGAIGIQTQTITAKGAVTIFNNSGLSLQPKSSNPVQLSAYGVLLNGNITAGSDININNGVVNDGDTGKTISVRTTPDTSFVKTAGVGSAALINLTSNFGSIKVGNYHGLTFVSTSQSNNSLRGIDLNANLVTAANGQDVTITNNAYATNEGGNGDTTGIYLQGSINSKGNIAIRNSSPPKYNYVQSFYGSAAGIVVAGLNATGNIGISNGTDITANKRSSAVSNIEAFGVKLTGLVKAGGALSVENSGQIQANTLGQPAASYAVYGIEILGGRNISVTAATIDLRNSGAVSAIDTNNNSISNINAAAYGIDIAANMTTTAGDIPAYQSTPLVPSININVLAATNGNSMISAYGKAYGVNITGSLNSAGQIYANVSVSVKDDSASTSKDNLLTGAAYGIVSTGSLTAVGGISLLVNETVGTNQISSVHGSATGISQTGAINAGNGVTEIVGGLVTANVTNATGILSSGGITSLGGAVKVKTTATVTGVTSAASVLLAQNVQSSYNSRTRRTTYFTLPVVTSAGDISITQSGTVTASAGSAYGVSAHIMNSAAGNISITQNGAVTGTVSADGVILASANAGKAAYSVTTTTIVNRRPVTTTTKYE